MRNIQLPSNLRDYRYIIEVEGVPCAAFRECSGLHAPEDLVEFYIGDDEISLLDIAEPGHDLVIRLSKGVTFDESLIDWERMTEAGHPIRHDGTITEYDNLGRVRARWCFSGAWPSTWQVARNAGNGKEIDSLEIVYEALVQS